MFGGDSLSNFYRANFMLSYIHKYSLTELEELYPFERDIYIQQLNAHFKEKERERK